MSHHDVSYLAPKENWRKTALSWIFTIDHKKIGVMYLTAVLFAFLLGGIFALMVRMELWSPKMTDAAGEVTGVAFDSLPWFGGAIKDNTLYNHLFSLHGTIMVFLFIIPSIPAALGNIF
ncbi:MAG: cbb3-type cytochrome c oxidase subunit I, partial [Phycisphaerales bacterium]|nr:cbb3-type cytochrome c oxidase subunit I [Phycisphaerales bacterium]